MNAYEQVCFYSASNGDTSAQTHKVVGIARHYRFHAGFRTDELHEAACNGEYDILSRVRRRPIAPGSSPP